MIQLLDINSKIFQGYEKFILKQDFHPNLAFISVLEQAHIIENVDLYYVKLIAGRFKHILLPFHLDICQSTQNLSLNDLFGDSLQINPPIPEISQLRWDNCSFLALVINCFSLRFKLKSGIETKDKKLLDFFGYNQKKF